MAIIVGVDPGLHGGLAFLDADENTLSLEPMPTAAAGARKEIDEGVLCELLSRPHVRCVFIERAQAMPQQGVVSMFHYGVGWGLVRGVCAGLGVPYVLVRPQEWQHTMLAGQPKGSNYLVATRLWPNCDFRVGEKARKPHDGLVDAALIAEYGRRVRNGKEA